MARPDRMDATYVALGGALMSVGDVATIILTDEDSELSERSRDLLAHLLRASSETAARISSLAEPDVVAAIEGESTRERLRRLEAKREALGARLRLGWTPEAAAVVSGLCREVAALRAAITSGPGGIDHYLKRTGVYYALLKAGALTMDDVAQLDRRDALRPLFGIGPKRLQAIRDALTRYRDDDSAGAS